MKKLSVYLETNNMDELDQSVLHHCFIHEAFFVKHHLYYTFESTVIFPGCKEIIQYIDSHFNELKLTEFKTHTVIFNSEDIISNCFFKELKIRVKISNNQQETINGAY